jgi:hypothetical protein
MEKGLATPNSHAAIIFTFCSLFSLQPPVQGKAHHQARVLAARIFPTGLARQ